MNTFTGAATLRRISTLLLACALLLGLSSFGATAYAGDLGNESDVYVDGKNGSDKNSGKSPQSKVATIGHAMRIAGDNATIHVSGTMKMTTSKTLDLKKCKIVREDGFTGALLLIEGLTVTLTGSGAVIDGKGGPAEAPLVTLVNSNVTITGGLTITGGNNSSAAVHTPTTENWRGQGGGIGVRGGSLTIENATVTGNTATLGGGIFTDGATLTLNNGAHIDGNTAKWEGGPNNRKAAGGGIFQSSVLGESVTYINAGATVNDNDASTGSAGGGIAMGRTKADEKTDYTFNVKKGSLYLKGGQIKGNKSGLVGGGIFVSRNCYAELTSGDISDNVANPTNDTKVDFSGGGVYAEDSEWDRVYYQSWDPTAVEAFKKKAEAEGRKLLPGGHIKITNAKVTRNTAYRGGGIALCQMGDGQMSPTSGAAIYKNTSTDKKGKDVWISRSSGSTSTISLPRKALADVDNRWRGWRDGTGEEVDPYFIGAAPSGGRNWVYFDNGIDDSAKMDAAAQLTITGNSTTRYGGGVANNGFLEIGEFTGGFYIKKVDGTTDKPLAGAQFRLTGPFGYDQTSTTADATTQEGVLGFRGLLDGEYTLVEVKAPEGYPDQKLKWNVKVEKGKVAVTGADGKTVEPTSSVSDKAGHTFPSYTIVNSKGGDAPALKTVATVKGTDSHVASAEGQVTIVDTVTYTNVKRGKYTIRGTLMDKSTGKAVLVDGKEVTAGYTGDLEGEGQVEMVFGPFDAKSLAGTKAVVFEQLLDAEGKVVASHEDINDEAQTVEFQGPKKGELSFPVSKVDDGKAALAGAELKVTDSKGATIEEWTSTDKPHVVAVPGPGTYTLAEVKAPKGYDLADPIKIEVSEKGIEVKGKTVTTVEMVDKKTGNGKTNTGLSKTGAATGAALGAMALFSGAGAFLVRRRHMRSVK